MSAWSRLPLRQPPEAIVAWMTTASPMDLMRLARAEDGAYAQQVAEHAPLARLDDDDLWALAADPIRRIAVFRNPTLTDAQVAAFVARTVTRPAAAALVQRLHGVAEDLARVGRTAARAALVQQVRAYLAAADGAMPPENPRGLAEAVALVLVHAGETVTPAETVRWHPLVCDYPHVCCRLAGHPSAPPAVLEAIAQRLGSPGSATSWALAQNPALRRAPRAVGAVLAQGHAELSLLLAPLATAATLGEALALLASDGRDPRHAEANVRAFFAALPPVALARLTPESLLPLLTSPVAALRLEGQLRLGTVAPLAESPPQRGHGARVGPQQQQPARDGHDRLPPTVPPHGR